MQTAANWSMPSAFRKISFVIAAKSAVCKINIDSDLRLGMTAGIRQHFMEHPDHFDPRQYIADGRKNVKDIVAHKIKDVLGSDNKI
jgi:fructose-bisphosphate aldolase class II